jgi:predicted transcriptional regulator
VGNPERIDPFISTEEEIELDAETADAIQRGIEDADAGRIVPLEEVRERMEQWLPKIVLTDAALADVGWSRADSPGFRRGRLRA